jgi:hypothetical protein
MYHTIDDLCKKIDIIKLKSDALRNQAQGISIPEEIQFEIDDIQALCREIANDTSR